MYSLNLQLPPKFLTHVINCQLKFSNLMSQRNIKFNKFKFWYLSKTCPLPMFQTLVNIVIAHFTLLAQGIYPGSFFTSPWISPSWIISQKTPFLLSLNISTIWQLLSSLATNSVQFTIVRLIVIQYFYSIQSTQAKKVTFWKYKPFHITHLISTLHWASLYPEGVNTLPWPRSHSRIFLVASQSWFPSTSCFAPYSTATLTFKIFLKQVKQILSVLSQGCCLCYFFCEILFHQIATWLTSFLSVESLLQWSSLERSCQTTLSKITKFIRLPFPYLTSLYLSLPDITYVFLFVWLPT